MPLFATNLRDADLSTRVSPACIILLHHFTPDRLVNTLQTIPATDKNGHHLASLSNILRFVDFCVPARRFCIWGEASRKKKLLQFLSFSLRRNIEHRVEF